MVKFHGISLAGFATAFALGLAAPASSQIAFNDFSAGNGGFGYDETNQGYSVQGSSVNGGFVGQAMEFSSLSSGFLADVILPISYLNDPGSFNVVLTSDNGSDMPGTALDSWTMAADGKFVANTYLTPTTLSGNNAVITAGVKYWLEVIPTLSDTSGHYGWFLNNSGAGGVAGRQADTNNGSAWSPHNNLTMGTFRVDLRPSPTPEPVTLGLGFAGIVLAARRKLKAQ